MISPQKPSLTVKFLCSYGGKIIPRPSDGLLRYVGGHTRVVSVDRSVSFAELIVKLSEMCGKSVALRCQLPGEEMDVLVSVKSDEDLASVFDEYDCASSSFGKQLKIRAILSPTMPPIRSNNSSPMSSSSNSPTKSSDPYCFQSSRSTAPMLLPRLVFDSRVGSTTACTQYMPDRNQNRNRFQPCHVQAHYRVLHSNYYKQ